MDEYREYTATVELMGEKYPLLLTTRAARELAERYGGLEKITDHLSGDDAAGAMCEVAWIVALLANQPILRHNRLWPDKRKDLLNASDVELFSAPSEVYGFSQAIMNAVNAGTKRNVPDGEGTEQEKNVENG